MENLGTSPTAKPMPCCKCVLREADCLKIFPSGVQRTVFTLEKPRKQTNKKEKNCTEFDLLEVDSEHGSHANFFSFYFE